MSRSKYKQDRMRKEKRVGRGMGGRKEGETGRRQEQGKNKKKGII
jgi:hypothetical protein